MLALLLRADLSGAAARKCEHFLKTRLSFDLAADVADDLAEPVLRDTQRLVMPPELLGMGVTARHHRGSLGHASIYS